MAIFHNRIINQDRIYLAGLVLIALSLPLSHFGMSLGVFILLGNWLLEGNFRIKFTTLRNHPGIILFDSVFLLCLLGLINTKNFGFAWHDIVIKSPILVFPLIIGTSKSLDTDYLRIVIAGLLAGLWISTLAGAAALIGFLNIPVNDIREISLFISHIRLALLLGLIMQIIFYRLIINKGITKKERFIYLVSIVWFAVFLFMLKSVTGFLMLGLFFVVSFILALRYIKNYMLKYFLIILGVVIILLAASWITRATVRFYSRDPLPALSSDAHTINGNKYDYHPEITETENGHYIWLYVCEKELRKEWNKAGKPDYNGRDRKGQELRITLIRYMTSKGLRKDSLGFTQMTRRDIENVKNGMTNVLFTKRFSLYPYFYQLLWERKQYKTGKSSSGHSHMQRIVYLKTGWKIAKDHFWFGTGTGDLQNMFDNYYRKYHFDISPEWRLRAHNQYLTYLITYGIFGFLYFLFAFFSPLLFENKQKDFLAVIFLLIAALSMLYEDTLETQAGVFFIVYFYSLFIFGRKNNSK